MSSSMRWACLLGLCLSAGGLRAEPLVAPYRDPDLSQRVLTPTRPFVEEPPALASVYGGVEYLHWRLKNARLLAPLVTSDVSGDSGGVLGDEGTRLVLGRDYLSETERPGGRLLLGTWFDDWRGLGVEASFFYLTPQAVGQTVSDPNGARRLAIPYRGGSPTTDRVFTLTDQAHAGDASLALRSHLLGADLYGVVHGVECCNLQFDVLLGARYLYLAEDLTFTLNRRPRAGGAEFTSEDWFGTYNHFVGPGAGAALSWARGRISANLLAKVAYGIMSERVNISGRLSTNRFTGGVGPAQSYRGGFFAQPSNLGHSTKVRMAVLPEVNCTIGLQLSDHLRASIGYGALYTDTVARPGEQIDARIAAGQSVLLSGEANPPDVAGSRRPERRVRDTDFWAHGLNVGLEFQF